MNVGDESGFRADRERFRLAITVFLGEAETGGMILQIPYLEASFSILKMYEIGS